MEELLKGQEELKVELSWGGPPEWQEASFLPFQDPNVRKPITRILTLTNQTPQENWGHSTTGGSTSALQPQKTHAGCRQLNKQGENLKIKMPQQQEQLYPLRESVVRGGTSASIKDEHTGGKIQISQEEIVW